MLDIARERCPETTFHHADMERFELDRCVDVVTCLFGSIGYTRTAQRMAQAIGRLALHLNTDGLLILEPWLTPEAYRPGEITADFIDLPELKACRMYLAELEQDASRFDIEYLVADRDGTRRFSETHLLGLIRHDAYCNACQDAGLTIVLDDGNLFGYGLIAAVRSA
jgi:hypothetical protein